MSEPAPVYVYGVSAPRDGEGIATRGVGGSKVREVRHAGMVALTSPLKDEALSAQDVRAHWRVLEQAFEHGTVLPLRFGTVMESDEAVRQRLLEANAERLSGLLEDMAGLVQLNVKGTYDEEAVLSEIVRASPAVAELRERLRGVPAEAAPAEQLHLGRMVEAEIGRRTEDDAATALDLLQPLAIAARADEVAYPVAFSLAFLVRDSGEAQFSKMVAKLADRLGERVGIRYVGPMPPFSFADTELRSGAWA